MPGLLLLLLLHTLVRADQHLNQHQEEKIGLLENTFQSGRNIRTDSDKDVSYAFQFAIESKGGNDQRSEVNEEMGEGGKRAYFPVGVEQTEKREEHKNMLENWKNFHGKPIKRVKVEFDFKQYGNGSNTQYLRLPNNLTSQIRNHEYKQMFKVRRRKKKTTVEPNLTTTPVPPLLVPSSDSLQRDSQRQQERRKRKKMNRVKMATGMSGISLDNTRQAPTLRPDAHYTQHLTERGLARPKHPPQIIQKLKIPQNQKSLEKQNNPESHQEKPGRPKTRVGLPLSSVLHYLHPREVKPSPGRVKVKPSPKRAKVEPRPKRVNVVRRGRRPLLEQLVAAVVGPWTWLLGPWGRRDRLE